MKPHVGLAFSYKKHAAGDICNTGEEAKNILSPAGKLMNTESPMLTVKGLC